MCVWQTFIGEYSSLGLFSHAEARRFFMTECKLLPFAVQFLTDYIREYGSKTPEYGMWDAAAYYAVMVIGKLMDQTWLICQAPEHERVALTKTYELAAEELVKAGGVPLLIAMAKGQYGVLQTIGSVWALRQVTAASYAGAEAVLKHEEGMKVLGHMFYPTHFSKLVTARIGAANHEFTIGDRSLIGISTPGTQGYMNPFSMTHTQARKRVQNRIDGVMEGAGGALGHIVRICGEVGARGVLGNSKALSAMWKWLAVPSLRENPERSVMTSAANLLCELTRFKPIAVQLLKETDLATCLERLLFMPTFWPLDEFLKVARNLSGHGGIGLAAVVGSKPMLTAVAACIECEITIVRDPAIEAILHIVTRPPTRAAIRNNVKTLLDVGLNLMLIMSLKMGGDSRECLKIMDQVEKNAAEELTTHMRDWARRINTMDTTRNAQPNFESLPEAQQKALLKAPALQAFTSGRHEEAIELYLATTIVYTPGTPDGSIAYSNCAECALKLRQHRRAIMFATHAIVQLFDQSPVVVKSLHRRYRAFMELGMTYEAINDLAQCVELDRGAHPEWAITLRTLHRGYVHDTKGIAYHTCAQCAFSHYGSMAKCACCEAAYYCSRACQAEHWSTHRPVCAPTPRNDTPATAKEDKK